MAARQTGTASSGNRRAAGKKASSSGTRKKSTASGKRTTKKSTAAAKGTKSRQASSGRSGGEIDYRLRSGMYDEIEMIIALAISILLLLSIYDLCGTVGAHISYFIFGVFGWIAYLIPYMVFFGTAFYISNRHNRVAVVKILAGILLFISVTAFLQMLSNPGQSYVSVLDFYEDSAVYKNGGGIVGGAICRLLVPLFGIAGSYLLIVALFAVSVVLLAGKSVFVSVLKSLQRSAVAAAKRHQEHKALMDEARQQRYLEEQEARLAAGEAAFEAEDYDDIDDFDDLDIEAMDDEAGLLPIGKKRGKKSRRRKKDDTAAMVEPENAYGKSITPIGFELPKGPADGASSGDVASGSASSTPGTSGAPDTSDAADSAVAGKVAADGNGAGTANIQPGAGSGDLASVSSTPDTSDATADGAAADNGKKSAAKRREIELPDLTITRMENIHKDEELDFDFSPDPVYLEPDEDIAGMTAPDVEIPDFMQKPLDSVPDPFGTTARLPKVTIGEFPEEFEIKDIREKSIEEKYTNLPEYEPKDEDISPLDAVKMAAMRAGGPADAAGRDGGVHDAAGAGGRRSMGGGSAEMSGRGHDAVPGGRGMAAGENGAMPPESGRRQSGRSGATAVDNTPEPVTEAEIVPEVKEYVFPPLELLKRGKPMEATADSDAHLKETAQKLQETLDSFGVKVHVTNVSCGPSVTRYELSPEQGVKVSRILSLTDDIKLNLAVADIRIEAPIPGKAAVGIEVPNKENTTVMLRDLLESSEFKNSKSLIAFAAGRDIGGQVIIADIAKMPHLLIAGATGSGKSVCINTLIMSIIYKAKPEDVRLIMIDPKVVELSVYNGIPHLLIPVVTDPKKAAGALNWGVAEMEKRYAKFAELNVRDMKSYNAKIEACEYESEEHKRLPQIVIIVDELADLMMVASNEVEDAICRLAQLARAAGIHLVIATQRPSVNVITGLIKANIPSRIAFSVSSGVDSRTIIDMNGAEKLLGKGDMLFYPTGYQKPVRVQGAFVSDQEVNAVVEFLTKDQEKPQYNESIVNSISSGKLSADKSAADDRDVYFVEAGRMIIEKDKASIGMLQRVYRIGFNRAARIMDQLYEAGVVGPEEGTKPRKVLMSPEQFEQYVDEYV